MASERRGRWGMMWRSGVMRVNSALGDTSHSFLWPDGARYSLHTLLGLCWYFFGHTWLNHMQPPWMSWLCTEPKTVGYQIDQTVFFSSYSRYVSLGLFPTRSFPPLFLLGDGVTQVCRLEERASWFVQTSGENVQFFSYFCFSYFI